jgi:sortase A
MQPQKPQQSPQDGPLQPFRRHVKPLPARGSHAVRTDREAAAHIMRTQIDHIYDTDSPHRETETAIRQAEEGQQAIALEDASPYARNHTASAAHQETATQWQHYHSAWQNYYRQYYERYYVQQVHATRNQLEARAQAAANPAATTVTTTASHSLSTDQAVNELRNNLLDKVRHSATSVRRSRHFMPLVSALVVGLLFTFLQYNRLIFAQAQAYISPGNIDPQNVILDPTVNVQVDGKPRLIIPKINVDAPVVYSLGSIAEDQVQKALENGVVHYPIPGANSVPGQVGNTAILGHSSNDVFDNGAYKFIFVQLDKLQIGDTFYAHYKGIRYTYSVTKKEIIEPTDIAKLAFKTNKPVMTLITCTPPGTALKRLIIVADQVSPDPDKATATPTSTSTKKPKELPANSPSLLQRLFGE